MGYVTRYIPGESEKVLNLASIKQFVPFILLSKRIELLKIYSSTSILTCEFFNSANILKDEVILGLSSVFYFIKEKFLSDKRLLCKRLLCKRWWTNKNDLIIYSVCLSYVQFHRAKQ